MEDLGELAPLVQILDLPMPQMVDYVADSLRILDFPIAEQFIEVPKISCSPCPSRFLVPEPQSAEQLVEVPTVLSPTRIALRIAEQIVDYSSSLVVVFKVFSHNRVQQRRLLLRYAILSGLSSRSLTFLLLVVALDGVLPHLLVCRVRQINGFFALFPVGKSAASAAVPSPRVPASVSVFSAIWVGQWIHFWPVYGEFWKFSHVLYVKVGFGSILRGWLDDLKRASFAAFCGIFRTPSAWT